jgi:hypothetical protein
MNITRLIHKNSGTNYACVKHLPSHIQKAIRLANFRPIKAESFANCSKLMLFQNKIKLTFCEGIVEHEFLTGFMFTHAWIKDQDDFHHDITLDSLPSVVCHKEYSADEVKSNVLKNKIYSPINKSWLDTMLFAIHNNIDTSLPLEHIEHKIAVQTNELSIELNRLHPQEK